MTTSLRRTFHKLTVAHVERLTDDAVAVTFDVPEELASEYTFRAGQSLTLRRIIDGRDERRSYSICAMVGLKPRIGVREVPGGAFSPWLVHEVKPGDTIEVLPPTGDFTPASTPARHVLLAAGSGITPVMSILSTVLQDPAASAVVLYGNRRTNTVMFADELADLKDRYTARMELVHVLSREPREAELFTGRLDAAKLRILLPMLLQVSKVDHWWLCGPFGMVTDAREVLTELGVPRDRIHFELFYVEDEPPEQVQHVDPGTTGPSAEVTVRLDGRTTTAVVARDTTLLEGAQRVRPDLPFACKGGVCGTCRAKVVSGKVHMRRNFALEDAEVDAGFVVTCQTVPTSDAVEIDFDQ
ncbi:phenylacetate-CoA oxygenase/reductase subunit PaaK [Kibdelosporangium philippinense]|uniref:Phenylacetate-CoA oxygenase/reductase subunit PaaK n=1 Tax=Kibdelosporangium philippinense TaxID=211113 RepID=A0ABS8ZGC7_9PSEU|nr:1,2-phenylacetyl-CoA epoxidase subunit PaaE [Kibdelosporangium philippinense]MCE7006502.1 phenylacetate-CoA oxygenase/reductase subunit PaaK [Kibdelosporangium philippinense]